MTVIEAVRALAPTIAARAAEAEALRTMPPDTPGTMRTASCSGLRRKAQQPSSAADTRATWPGSETF